MKRYLFLTLVVLLCTLSASAYDFKVDSIAYDKLLYGKSVSVAKSYYEGDIVIPESVTYDGVTYSVTEIGYNAFGSCTRLNSITIGNSVTKIGKMAFFCCSGLTSATIGTSVTEIGYDAFANCTGLSSIIIPNSVTTIDEGAFGGCNSLTSVTIGNSVSTIGRWAFDYTAWFKKQPDGMVYIGKVAYKYKGQMPSNTSIAIKEGSVSISPSAFENCSGLSSITIPNSVNTIGNEAFKDCTELTSITIPNSVNTIGNETFKGCSGLATVTFNAEKCSATSDSQHTWFKECPLTSLVIGNGVKSIPSYLVYNQTSLKTVTIGNSVTKIGFQAFSGCNGLISVSIPNSVTEIDTEAFSYCKGLTSVSIDNSSVTTIGRCAFYKCPSLTSVSIPNSVTEIGAHAFKGTPWYNNQPDGVVYIGEIAYKFKGEMASGTAINIKEGTLSISEEAFYGCSRLTSVTIPNSVTKIGFNAFENCTGLTTVTLPNSVTEIGLSAFQGCTGLASVTIPNSVTEIGYRAFENCTGLTSVSLPNSVTKIGQRAFYGCTGLTSITIGDSITEIGDQAFSGCTCLASVIISNSVPKIGVGAFNGTLWYDNQPDGVVYLGKVAYRFKGEIASGTAINIKEGTVSISEKAFGGCTGLVSITIPNSVNTIGNAAFHGCSCLTSVTIPNSVTKIDYNAFESCTGLSSITIGCSVTEIGTGAFKDCIGLKKVYSLNPVPPVIKPYLSSTNRDLYFYDADLFVPQGCLSAYKSAKGWSDFSHIKEFQVTVKAESILLNEHSTNLMIGDTLSLTAKVLPENVSTKTVAWSSNNPEVASVNDEGLVTALTAGTAIISATTTDGTVLSDSATIVVSTPISAPSLSVGNYVCVNGDIVTVALSLANKQEIGGFQTDFTVPDGFTVALNSKGKYDITLNADRCVDHVVTTNKLSDGPIRVLAYSPSAEPFIGESGEICYIKLVADEDVKEGDHQLVFREILISESNGKGHRCDDITSVLSTMPVILGDVNNDHKVNVQDVLLTANVSVGKDVDGFVFRAADVNKDGIINVSDVLLVANIAVGNSVTVSAAPRFGESHDVLHVADFMLSPGEERTVDVMLDNTVDFSALQMNLRLPAGVNLKKVALTGRATDGHAVVYNENTPGNINLMAFAASTENFTGNDGAILKLTLQADKNFCGEGAIELTDVKLAESDGYTRKVDDASARISAVTTGVESVYSDVCAYAEGQSIVIEATDAGRAQIVRPNGVMQEVKVNVGRNTYPMADGGIYFIRFAGKTFKVII